MSGHDCRKMRPFRKPEHVCGGGRASSRRAGLTRYAVLKEIPMGLVGFVLRRLMAAIPAVGALVVATFLIMRVLPGDPAVFFASSPVPTAEETAYVRQKLGLDRSVPEQLLIYLRDIGAANLGMSFTTGRPVLTELTERLPASLELATAALLLAMAVSIPLGVAAAIWAGSPLDHAARVISSIGVSMPTFVTGLILTY